MANYLFENMTDAQAASYNNATDHLYFLTGDAATVGVTVTPSSTSGLTTTAASITLSNSGVTHTFAADAFAGQNFTFFGSNSADTLQFGHDSSGDTATVAGTSGAISRYYGLGGDDNITGSAATDSIYGGEGNDTIHGVSAGNQADFLMGGNGNDVITGGSGNDHIFGNLSTSTAGAADGNDTITVGTGSNYVNGNAGDDTITVSTTLASGYGSDTLYGGNGNDTVTGGLGNDYLQGNKGNDVLDGGNGNDTIRGGADNDMLTGGNGNDHLMGDNGNDTLIGGAGYDDLTGGNGADVFQFAAGDASDANLHTASTAAGHDVTDFINDFVHGTDTISLTGFTGGAGLQLLHTAAGVTFTSVDQAEVYAQQLMDNNAGNGEIAAITVGSDTYLFYSGNGGATIDSAIKLVGVQDSVLTASDFTVAP